MPNLPAIADHLDQLLRTREIPDYAPALNGVQLENRGEIVKVAAAVDFSRRVVERTIGCGANLLLVHHGIFWGGLRPISGQLYDRIAPLMRHNIAVYASHLPLDAHPKLGNNVLLARELGLEPSAGFARYQTIDVGVQGVSDVPTEALIERARVVAKRHGGDVIATPSSDSRMTKRWGICTGAGADANTIREALDAGIDTLIVGEGPHYTAVEAVDVGLAIIYVGHYATETFGIRALAEHLGEVFDLPWEFIEAPTGL
ncbi:MAG: Nif3-like dinuclear metal center hexameric protein [Gemmatimonadaceae bacterium]